MLTHEIRITIPGRPTPKGSMKCVGRRGKVAHQLVEQVDNEEWRRTVVQALRHSWPTGDGRTAGRHQPIGAEITTTLPRPGSHYGTGRNAHTVKPSAPAHPATHGTGDVDKLARLILDALQDGAVLPDDAAVVELVARKAYPRPGDPGDVLGYPGVVIRLYPLEAP